MSEELRFVKDPRQKAYLEHLRQRSKERMSICYKCDKSSIGITAEGYSIYPACLDHTRQK